MGNNYVYHFTTFESLKAIIESNSLRISSINKMNDINENVVKYPKSLKDIGPENIKKLERLYGDRLKNNTYIYKVFEQAKEEALTIHSNIYSLSFSELYEDNIFDCDLLWAHYGDKHYGAVIKFNKVKIIELMKAQFSSIFCKDINYLIKTDLKDNICSTFNDLLLYKEDKISFDNFIINSQYFHKLNCWNYENEFRCLIFDESKKEYLLLNKIIDSIEEIVLGYNCEYFRFNDIKVTRCDDSMWPENPQDIQRTIIEAWDYFQKNKNN